MRYLDLIKLLSSKALTTTVKLTKNGLFYKVSALLNIGANMKLYYILAYAFYIIIKNRKQVEILITSLYEIDSLIYRSSFILYKSSDRHNLLKKYKQVYNEYALAFSKVANNQLSPYYPYDYKIDLEENAKKALKYSPLYKISILELKAVKAYLINNFDKGFIKALSIPYATPILFIKKPNGSLRLYRYLLLLIDKTLAYLSTFYYIYIDLDSEELITFRIYYRVYKSFAKLNYAIYNKEMLAIIRSFRYFRLKLIGLPYKIKVYTNYKALEYFISNKDLNS
ncbi:unnamed protein product [Diplocarpon coronariae]